MSNLILPDDPDFDKPIIMGNPFEVDRSLDLNKQAITPGTKQAEMDRQRAENPNTFKYANTLPVSSPEAWQHSMTKISQSAGVSNMMTQPMWFSPLHTPQNWQVASKRREVYQWLNLLTPYSQVLTSDYTFKNVSDIQLNSSCIIQDTITDGLIYEDLQTESIIDGTGILRKPVKYGVRECYEKRSFTFSAYGYWRNYDCTEEHPVYVLDGKMYRLKKKVEKGAIDRRRKGIKPNGVKKVNIPHNLIVKKQAQDVDLKDYLLAPVPCLGKVSLPTEKAWMIGLYAADGCCYSTRYSSGISFTMDKNEAIRSEIEDSLQCFGGQVGSRKHGDGNGWRVSVSTHDSYDFFDNYISSKRTQKRFAPAVFQLDKESILHLLGGYLDGDGCFNSGDHKLVANNYSCDMADQIYWMLLSVGIHASLGKYRLDENHYPTDSEWYYRIFIPQSDVPKLKPYMRSSKVPEDFIPKKTRELRFFHKENGTLYYALSQVLTSSTSPYFSFRSRILLAEGVVLYDFSQMDLSNRGISWLSVQDIYWSDPPVFIFIIGSLVHRLKVFLTL